jgi:hypothetical protein
LLNFSRIIVRTSLPKLFIAFVAFVGAAAFLLVGCAGLLGPREVEIPLARLQASLDKKFPLSQRPMELIDIRLSRPQLSLQPQTNRVSVAMDAAVAPLFTQRIWRGSFTLSGVLQLDPIKHDVVLTQPVIEKIALDGISQSVADQVARAAGMLASQLVKDLPLYHFNPDEFRYGGSNFLPTRIVTKSSGLVVTFEPIK